MVVAGQVAATDEPFAGVDGMPSETEISKTVVSLPASANGKFMGASANFETLTETGQVVKCSIQPGKGGLLAQQIKFDVVDSKGEPFTGGLYVKEFKNLLGLGKSRYVMYDANDKPICVAHHDSTRPLNKIYYIDGLVPLVEGDEAFSKEGDVEFYRWFKMHDLDDTHLNYRTVTAWNGKAYYPMIRIKPVSRKPGTDLGRLIPPRKCDLVVCDSSDEDKVYALFAKIKGEDGTLAWHLCAAPGTDVMPMIMALNLMNTMVEFFG